MKRAKKILCCAVVILGLPGVALADGAIRDGLGARSSGRGGTNIAFSDNGSILHDNVAGMANIEGTGFVDAGIDILITDLAYSDPDNAQTGAFDNPLPLGQFSIIKKSADGLWSYGFGTYAPAGFAAQFDLQGPAPFTGKRNYKSFGSLLRILPGVAYHATDRLSVGATLGVAVSHMELEGPYFLQKAGPLRGTPTILDLQATGAALTWSVGLQYELLPTTTIGVAYQSETNMRLDGNSRIETTTLGQSYYDTDLQVTWPRSLGVGIKHEICPHRTFSTDVIWYNWRQAFDDFGVQFSNATNPVFTENLGPGIKENLPLNWRDSVSIRLGYEQELTENQVGRIGYVYHRNPIPNSTLQPSIQTTLEHAFSVGYGWIGDRVEIDLAYQFSFNDPNNVTTSSLAGGDYSGSRLQTRAHWTYISFLRRF